MKHLYRILYVLSFVIGYVVPVLMFGGVVDFAKDTRAGLSSAGWFAVALIAVFVLIKIKNQIVRMNHGIVRGVLLSVAPCLVWLVVYLGLNYVQSFSASVLAYWDKVIIFVGIGRLVGIVAEEVQRGVEDND